MNNMRVTLLCAVVAAFSPAARLRVASPRREAAGIGIETLTSGAELDALSLTRRVVVVEYGKERCNPCKRMAPEYAAIADKYGDDDASFFVCRVDESAAASALGKREGVKIVPTCQVYKHGELLETVEGVRPDELDNAVMIAAGDNFVTDPVAVARKILARFGIWGACRKALVSGVRRLRAYFRQPGGVAPSLVGPAHRRADPSESGGAGDHCGCPSL